MNKNRTATSIGAIILMRPTGGATTGDQLECLIGMKRRGDKDNVGKWVFPNGGVNAGPGFTLKSELIREGKSETGLIIKPIHPTPFYLPRVNGDGLKGAMHKLFVVCTVTSGPSLVAGHVCDEIDQLRYRSIGHIRRSMHGVMAQAYLRALHYFSDTGVFNTLASQEEWPETEVETPGQLPPHALLPLGGSPLPNDACAA